MPFIGVGVTVLGFKRAFSPSNLPNLALWLKADAITGLTDGQAVATWNDSSGNGRNATQATGSAQPLYKTNIVNGKPVVRFDGNSDYLEGTWNLTLTAETVFVVFSYTGTAYARAWTQSDAGNDNAVAGYVPTIRDASTTSWGAVAGGTIVATVTMAQSTFGIFTATHSGSQIANRINGGTAATYNHTLNKTFTRYRAGNSTGANYLQGDIAEIIVYSRALSTTERQQVEQYLAQKYAITLA